jgi:hypothetical protein
MTQGLLSLARGTETRSDPRICKLTPSRVLKFGALTFMIAALAIVLETPLVQDSAAIVPDSTKAKSQSPLVGEQKNAFDIGMDDLMRKLVNNSANGSSSGGTCTGSSCGSSGTSCGGSTGSCGGSGGAGGGCGGAGGGGGCGGSGGNGLPGAGQLPNLPIPRLPNLGNMPNLQEGLPNLGGTSDVNRGSNQPNSGQTGTGADNNQQPSQPLQQPPPQIVY